MSIVERPGFPGGRRKGFVLETVAVSIATPRQQYVSEAFNIPCVLGISGRSRRKEDAKVHQGPRNHLRLSPILQFLNGREAKWKLEMGLSSPRQWLSFGEWGIHHSSAALGH